MMDREKKLFGESSSASFLACVEEYISERESRRFEEGLNNNNNNTQIAAIALPPLTTHPQLWAELLTFKPKCTIT